MSQPNQKLIDEGALNVTKDKHCVNGCFSFAHFNWMQLVMIYSIFASLMLINDYFPPPMENRLNALNNYSGIGRIFFFFSTIAIIMEIAIIPWLPCE